MPSAIFLASTAVLRVAGEIKTVMLDVIKGASDAYQDQWGCSQPWQQLSALPYSLLHLVWELTAPKGAAVTLDNSDWHNYTLGYIRVRGQ